MKKRITVFEYLLIFFFFTFSLGELGRISFFSGQINFYLYEFFLILIIFYLLIKNQFRGLFKKYFIHSALPFFVIASLSLFISFFHYSATANLIAVLYFLRLFSYFLFLGLIYNEAKKDKQIINYLEKGIMFFTLVTIVSSLGQYFFFPNLRGLFYLGWDPHDFRMVGLFLDSSLAGAIYGFLFLFFLLYKKKTNLYLAILLLIFVALSFSRGAYLSLIAAVIIYFFVHRHYRYLVGFLFLFAFFVLLAPKPFGEGVNLKRTFSLRSRAVDLKSAVKIWRRKPLLGIGYNHISEEKNKQLSLPYLPPSHANASFSSSWAIILATTGILGLISFAYFLLRVVKKVPLFSYWLIFLGLFSFFDNIILHPLILVLSTLILIIL